MLVTKPTHPALSGTRTRAVIQTPLHPRIAGTWARDVGTFSGPEVRSHAGGSLARWHFLPEDTDHPALRAGSEVLLYDGGIAVWQGAVQEVNSATGEVIALGDWTADGARYLQAVLGFRA